MDWWGPVLWEYYAGTELNGFCLGKPEEWLERPGTVGKPLIGDIHILDEEGNELPPGEAGTIYFGGGPPYEYHNAPDKTESSKDPKGHGWTTLRSEEHTSELQSLMRISYAVFCLKKKKKQNNDNTTYKSAASR